MICFQFTETGHDFDAVSADGGFEWPDLFVRHRFEDSPPLPRLASRPPQSEGQIQHRQTAGVFLASCSGQTVRRAVVQSGAPAS